MPQSASQVTRIAASTPSAVHGLGSPEPPRSTARPATWLGPLRDHGHVAVGGADVLRRDVAAAERVDGVAEVEQRVAPALAVERRVAGPEHDHALAAAQREAGGGRLERHRARQPQRVAEPRARVLVAPHAAAAERRAARGRVDRDGAVEAGARPPADEQLLVVDRLQMDRDAREPRERDGGRPLLRFAAMRRNLVALGIGIALLAGCGDDDEQEPAGQDLNAVRCPMVPTGEVENGVERFEPAKDSFDTAELIDEKLADAEKTAAEHGCNVVVSMKDGKGRAGDHGLRPGADLRLHRERRRHGDRRGRRRHLVPRVGSWPPSRPRAPAAAPAGPSSPRGSRWRSPRSRSSPRSSARRPTRATRSWSAARSPPPRAT